MQIVTAVIIGAGRRGQAYASYATVVPKKFRIVGVAEHFRVFRDQMVAEYGIKGENAFETCEQVVDFAEPVKVFDFLTELITEHEVCRGQWGKLGGHGGADFHLIQTFIDAVLAEDQSLIPTGPEETLESHHLVFAAERSRLENKITELHNGYGKP